MSTIIKQDYTLPVGPESQDPYPPTAASAAGAAAATPDAAATAGMTLYPGILHIASLVMLAPTEMSTAVACGSSFHCTVVQAFCDQED